MTQIRRAGAGDAQDQGNPAEVHPLREVIVSQNPHHRGAGAGDNQYLGNPTEIHLLREVIVSQNPRNIHWPGIIWFTGKYTETSPDQRGWVSGGAHKAFSSLKIIKTLPLGFFSLKLLKTLPFMEHLGKSAESRP